MHARHLVDALGEQPGLGLGHRVGINLGAVLFVQDHHRVLLAHAGEVIKLILGEFEGRAGVQVGLRSEVFG